MQMTFMPDDWAQLATDINEMSCNASMVVFCRTSQFLGGQLSQAEATRMIEEKPRALVSAYRVAFFTALRASAPAVTALAALEPVADAARDNASRLTSV